MSKEKPPLGLIPRKNWEDERKWKIAQAINRYTVAGFKIPIEWIEEYNDLVK